VRPACLVGPGGGSAVLQVAWEMAAGRKMEFGIAIIRPNPVCGPRIRVVPAECTPKVAMPKHGSSLTRCGVLGDGLKRVLHRLVEDGRDLHLEREGEGTLRRGHGGGGEEERVHG
jgi:hypothetical protein